MLCEVDQISRDINRAEGQQQQSHRLVADSFGAIKILIQIANEEGNVLRSVCRSWTYCT